MATHTAGRRPRHDTTPVIAAVVVIGVVLAGLLTWQYVGAQDRLATVRQSQVSGQATATGQRTDQTQLTCALWTILRDTKSEKLTAAVRSAADQICATVPTPTPSASQ